MSPFRLLLAAVAVSLALPAATAEGAVGDEIVVARQPGLSAAERADVLADAGVELERTLPLRDTEVVSAPAGERADALAALRADPGVRWAEPNRPRSIASTDPYWPRLWGLENTGQTVLGASGVADADIDAPEAWKLTKGRGVTVAVVDTGVAAHPDLSVVPGWDFVDDDADPVDGHGHGTHVSGTIAAAENGRGVIGVAPQARIMPIRVLDDSGRGSSADSAAGFAFAGDHGARIVNASLGASDFSYAERDAIRDHPGTLYVVAAGNSGRDVDTQPSYPCAYDLPNILCVGASDQSDRPASFSNRGAAGVDLHAPGVSILSTYKGSSYAYMDGTSMATPHAAGAAALLLARAPALDTDSLKRTLMDSADPVAALAGLSRTGGRLNAAAALAALPPDTTPPGAPTGLTATGGEGEIRLDWDDSAAEDVAEYRVYPAAGGAPVAAPSASSTVVAGLPAGARAGYRVTAVDRAGNESDAATAEARTADAPAVAGAAPATVAPLTLAALTATAPPAAAVPAAPAAPAATAPPATPATTPSTGAEAPAPLATLAHVRVAGRVVVCRSGCRTRTARLAFTLGAAAPVTVTLARRACPGGACRYRTAGTRTLRLAAGAQSLTAGTTLAGMRLSAGVWRVSLRTAAGAAAVTVRVATA